MMKKILLGTAAVAAAASGAFIGAAPAQAAVILSQSTQCQSSPLNTAPLGCIITYGAGGNTGVYDTDTQVNANGTFGSTPVVVAPFTDIYTFGTGTGTVDISLSTSNPGDPNGNMDIDFTLFRLDGPGGEVAEVTSGFVERTEPAEIFANVTAGQYYLTISANPGTTNGDYTGGPVVRDTSYSGTINFTAVPEPATWAMMLAGFGAVGYSMRRRKAHRLLQAV